MKAKGRLQLVLPFINKIPSILLISKVHFRNSSASFFKQTFLQLTSYFLKVCVEEVVNVVTEILLTKSGTKHNEITE